MEPLTPAGSPHRRGMPPSLLSPSSGSAFPAADVSEHPCVKLVEWWLTTVEGDDDQKKLAVAGIFKRNQTHLEYSSAPIAKRHTQFVLETEDGTILLINGSNSHNIAQTFSNGYSTTVCDEFLNGFPHWWQSCKPRCPDLTNSHTSNSGVDSTQFYLEKFELGKHLISKCHEILKSFSRNDAMFQKSSHLLNGTPRFEEYTCDGDIATNENAATSSEPATGNQRTPVVSLEVRGCRKETQHMLLTEKAAVDEGMPVSVNLDMQNSFCLSNGTPILEEDAAASNDNNDNERYTAISKEVTNVEIGLVTGSPSRERGHDDIATDASLALTVECTNNAVSEAVDSTPATECKKTPVASLKNQGSWRKNQHIASNKKVLRSPLTCGKATSLSMSTPEALKPKRSRSGHVIVPKLDEGCQSIVYRRPVGQPKKQISSHEKHRSATTSQGTRSAISHVLWSPLTRGKATSLSMCAPEALKLKRSRSGRVIAPKLDEGCQSIVYGRPVGQPRKQISSHEKHRSATRSQGTRSAISHVLWSPLTRGKATSLSMCTPEALKLKRSRSGRVIVPKLDEGCQSIVYGRDGLIAAVSGLDSPAMPKWSESKTDPRKKRRTE